MFSSLNFGAEALAGLTRASDENFYGTTFIGGITPFYDGTVLHDGGTVFQMTPDGTVTVLHAFTGGGTP